MKKLFVFLITMTLTLSFVSCQTSGNESLSDITTDETVDFNSTSLKTEITLKNNEANDVKTLVEVLVENQFPLTLDSFWELYPESIEISNHTVYKGYKCILVENEQLLGVTIAFANDTDTITNEEYYYMAAIRINASLFFPEYISKTKDELKDLGFREYNYDSYEVGATIIKGDPVEYYYHEKYNGESYTVDKNALGMYIDKLDCHYQISFSRSEILKENNFVYIMMDYANN